MIPQNLFDRLFGVRDQSWVGRKKSVLDAVREDLGDLQPSLGQADRHRLDEHLTSVRELEREQDIEQLRLPVLRQRAGPSPLRGVGQDRVGVDGPTDAVRL